MPMNRQSKEDMVAELNDKLERAKGALVANYIGLDVSEVTEIRTAFREAGVEVISPGCGACIGCGPGDSDSADQVSVSAINRNFRGRSGPGQLYLASPLTVAASAIEGRIVSYTPGMFRSPVPTA